MFRVIVYSFIFTISFAYNVGADWKNWFSSEPELSEEQMEWKIFSDGNTYVLNGIQFQVIEHGYKFIRIYKQEARKTSTREIPAKYILEWGWKLTVKNLSPEPCDFSFDYFLKDDDGFVVSKAGIFRGGETELIKSGDFFTLQKTSEFEYSESQVKRIVQGTWEAHLGSVTSARIFRENFLKSR